MERRQARSGATFWEARVDRGVGGPDERDKDASGWDDVRPEAARRHGRLEWLGVWGAPPSFARWGERARALSWDLERVALHGQRPLRGGAHFAGDVAHLKRDPLVVVGAEVVG